MGYGSPLSTRNKRWLATNSGNLSKTHLIEKKKVIKLLTVRVLRKKGG
jgi:hypothetical protein